MATMKKFLTIAFFISCLSFYCESVPVGESCIKDEECDGYPESTICDDILEACFCNDQHVPVDGNIITCQKIRDQIGEPCVVSDQCKKGLPGQLSDCIPSFEDPKENICNCTEGNIHQPGEHVCHEIRNLIGQPCEVDAQCSFLLGDLSACSNDKECSCLPGSINTIELDHCLPIRNELELECQIREQCFLGVPGFLSDCMEPYEEDENQSSKICNCTEIAINEPNDHKCYLRRENLGQQCKVNAQCRVYMGDLSECDDKDHCVCTENIGVPNLKNNFCLEIVNDIGNECTESQQCTVGVPGDLSECMPSFDDEAKFICNCTADAINQPGKNECHKKAEIVGDDCVEEAQCLANLGSLSECYLGDSDPGYCRCVIGTIPRANKTLCLAIRQQLGETCEESTQCQQGTPGQHSICLDGECACNSGATNEPGQHVCLERADIIGASCQVNMQCKANLGPLSECSGGVCTCTPEYGVGNRDGDFCIPVINSIGGEFCQEDIQCRKGVPGEYSDCLESDIVPGKNVCNCTVGAIHQYGRHKCYKVADKIGEKCDIQEQCQNKLGELSECLDDDQGCQCVEAEAIPNKEEDKCLGIIDKIGETCEENGQCVEGAPGKFSECGRNDEYPYDNICKCKDGAVKHPTNEKCLIRAVNVGDRCAVSLQCILNIGNLTECDNEGFCSCLDGAVGNAEGDKNTKCIPGGILIGNGCYDKAQCVGDMDETSTCHNGICGCLEEYTESMKLDNCLGIRDFLGDVCEEIQQCQQGEPGEWSECWENPLGGGRVCRCNVNATSEAGRHVCYPKVGKVGDSCDRNFQCVANLGQSQCLNKRCVCMEGSVANGNEDKCLSKVDLGQGCEDNNQCRHMDNVSCRVKDEEEKVEDNMCLCEAGFMEHPGKRNTCMKKAELIGDTCEDHESQCGFLGGASCDEDLVPAVCQCDDLKEVVSGDEKTCLKAIHNLREECDEQVQCQVVNSICSFYEVLNRTACICGNGYVEASNGNCVPVRSEIGQVCEDKQQCVGIGMNVDCIIGFCRCKEPFDNYENKCYVPSQLGANCNTTEQCHLGVNKLATCSNLSGRCACVEAAYEYEDICLATKIVGDRCHLDVECTNTIIGPVYCSRLSNVCTCEEGYKADTGGIRCSSAYSVLITGTNSVFYMIALIWSMSQYF